MVLFPWFPSPSMVTRAWATKQIYDIIVRAMKDRKQSGLPQNDALQMLLDSGEEHFTIVGVSILFFKLSHYSRRCVSLVYDGLRNCGGAFDWYCRRVRHPMHHPPQLLKGADFVSASWLVTYLGCHPKWRNEARAEIKKIIASHSLEIVSEVSDRNSSSTALSQIPLSAWENETPVLDVLIREAVRLDRKSTRLNSSHSS